MSIILASTSSARRALLSAAGVAHEALSPGVDEAAAKASLLAENATPREVADALAEILAPTGLTPAVLKAEGRYVEDVY